MEISGYLKTSSHVDFALIDFSFLKAGYVRSKSGEERGRAGKSRTGQGRAGQDRAEQGRAGQKEGWF